MSYRAGLNKSGWRCVTCLAEFAHDTPANPGKRWVWAAVILHTVVRHRRLPVHINERFVP